MKGASKNKRDKSKTNDDYKGKGVRNEEHGSPTKEMVCITNVNSSRLIMF